MKRLIAAIILIMFVLTQAGTSYALRQMTDNGAAQAAGELTAARAEGEITDDVKIMGT